MTTVLTVSRRAWELLSLNVRTAGVLVQLRKKTVLLEAQTSRLKQLQEDAQEARWHASDKKTIKSLLKAMSKVLK